MVGAGHSWLLLLLGGVCGGEDVGDVGGEQIVHLVAQRGLAEELGAPDEVADGHVEVSVATGPVGDPGEGMSDQDVLEKQQGESGRISSIVMKVIRGVV